MGVCLLILLLPAVPAQQQLESVVELKLVDTLEESDIGIHAGEMSSNGLVLLVGENGYAHIISALHADDRSQDIALFTGRNVALNDVSWHPQGQSALIAGDMGVALRYSTETHAITTVNGSGTILGLNMTAVEWQPGGASAYFGASDGSLWKFSEGSGMTAISDTRSSAISDIACHRGPNICVVATRNDGLAVLSPNHQLTFLSGTADKTWIGVDCADQSLNECVGFGSGLHTQVISLDMVDASKSTTKGFNQLLLDGGDFTGVSRGHGGTTLIHMAPFATIRQQPLIVDPNQAHLSQIISEDAMAWDPVVSGRAIEFIWENEQQDGFIITSFGNIVSFEPKSTVEKMDLMTKVVMAAVTISVPGVILGLMYMNSPFLQRKYFEYRALSKNEKVVAIVKTSIKAIVAVFIIYAVIYVVKTGIGLFLGIFN